MKRTPLYDVHRALGARLVEFAGWEMPVQYTGILDEHAAVRTKAGLFDVSHMGEVEVRGPHALEACQRISTNDLSRIRDGQAQYSLLCLPSGGVVDDVIFYRRSETLFFLCVNAGNREADFEWIREQATGAEVVDRSDEFAQLALQGPRATSILERLTGLSLASAPAFSFSDVVARGVRVMAARTGYTGEDGWEIYCAAADAVDMWSALCEAGAPEGMQPAGLGARDTLRLEAALPLYGHELTRETTPLEAGLARFVRTGKGEFLGRDELLAQERDGVRRRLVGIEMTGAGIPRQGYPVRRDGVVVGAVTSGTKSPTLNKAIGLAYVEAVCAEIDTAVDVEIRNKTVAARVVPRPFYRRPKGTPAS